jgi:hypothetical protein
MWVSQCELMKFDHCLKQYGYISLSSKYNVYSAKECSSLVKG